MKINPQEFVLKEIPKLHPQSMDYISFWREQKKRMIEGHWLGGYYMPPSLYYYVNFATIELSKKYSGRKEYSKPFLRDLEWDLFQAWTVAQGFSGFETDPYYSSHKALLDPDMSDKELEDVLPFCMNNGVRKKYIDPYEYLKMQHPANYEGPLFQNNFQNLMFFGSRDSGKSYVAGVGFTLHAFLTDGRTRYVREEQGETEDKKKKRRIEITVGANGAEKSKLLLNKVKIAMDFLPGEYTAGRYYPSPLSKRFMGSFALGKEIKAEYQVKVDGGWETKGSRSAIKHRSFKDNSFADQGSRPIAIVLEEAGLFSNLESVYHDTRDNLQDGLNKIGSLVILGTGGDMDSGTIDAARMFHSPEEYQILSFKDNWENRGKIAYFIPAAMVLNDYKDEEGNTLWDKALKELNKKREIEKKKSSEALSKFMQYRPNSPSEMFISKSANIFPAPELRRRIGELETTFTIDMIEKRVHLLFDPNGYNGVSVKVDTTLEPVNRFPWSADKSREGCVVMFEEPLTKDNMVPPGMYIIGCDPFKDDSTAGASLASVYVMKTAKYPHMGHNQIVASYVGRPYLGKNEVNEILHKLSLYYGNAKIYFENNVGNVKDYFEKVRRLDLLATQPITVFNKKASFAATQQFVYGYPISNDKVKWEAIQYLRSWLLEERGEGRRNLDEIPDIGLLQELMSFNMDGNFDRVLSLAGCIIGLEELNNLSKRSYTAEETSEMDKEFNKIFAKNSRLFRL